MINVQYYKLKNYIKAVAFKIKGDKRLLQKIRSSDSLADNHEEWYSAANFLKKYRPALEKNLPEIQRLSRYLHIVYSIARGKNYNQIEKKVRPGNKIDFDEIKFYFKKAGVEIPENFKNAIENVPVKQPREKTKPSEKVEEPVAISV